MSAPLPRARPTARAAASLLRAAAPEAVRCAFIVQWAASHAVDLGALPATSTAAGFVAPPLRDRAAREIEHLRAVALRPSLKDLENVFELSLDAQHRRAQGATYTPDAVIDGLVDTGLSMLPPGRARGAALCDPACGTGGFLLRAASTLAEREGLLPSEVLYTRLVGFDNDPRAIEAARCMLALFLLQRDEVPDERRFRLHLRDTLLTPVNELRALAPGAAGFDLVATNPPYVRVQSLGDTYANDLVARYGPLLSGSFSLAPLFLLAGRELLREGGVLAVITQNNLFTSLSGKAIRRRLQELGALRRIVDFGHRQVFENASAYTCLVFLGASPAADFEFGELAPEAPLAAVRDVPLNRIATSSLQPAKWRLAAPKHLDNLRRIESIGAPLGALAEIRVGFATLKDAVFLVRQVGEVCVPLNEPGAAPTIELAATRPAIKVAELDTEADLDRNALRVLFPYERRDGRYRLLDEDALRARFPGAWAHLRRYRDALAGRDKGAKDYGAWFAWGRTQAMEAAGPKLLTKTFSRRPAFFRDESDALFCNGYSVSLPPTSLYASGLDLRLLQRILNSAVMHYFARLTSFKIEGDYQCYQKNFIERFGVPDLDRAAATALRDAPDDVFEAGLFARYGIAEADVREIVKGAARRGP